MNILVDVPSPKSQLKTGFEEHAIFDVLVKSTFVVESQSGVITEVKLAIGVGNTLIRLVTIVSDLHPN